MEEADAVCDRLAIQVLGQLRCLGTTIHLKDKYGSGNQLEVIVKNPETSSFCDTFKRTEESQHVGVTEFIQSTFSPNSRLLEAHAERCLYQLPSRSAGGPTLGEIFTKIQEARERLCIEE